METNNKKLRTLTILASVVAVWGLNCFVDWKLTRDRIELARDLRACGVPVFGDIRKNLRDYMKEVHPDRVRARKDVAGSCDAEDINDLRSRAKEVEGDQFSALLALAQIPPAFAMELCCLIAVVSISASSLVFRNPDGGIRVPNGNASANADTNNGRGSRAHRSQMQHYPHDDSYGHRDHTDRSSQFARDDPRMQQESRHDRMRQESMYPRMDVDYHQSIPRRSDDTMHLDREMNALNIRKRKNTGNETKGRERKHARGHGTMSTRGSSMAMMSILMLGLSDTVEANSNSVAVSNIMKDKLMLHALSSDPSKSTYGFGVPGCADRCGPIISYCKVKGWMSTDMYYLWDDGTGLCQWVKVNMASDFMQRILGSATTAIATSLITNAADGIDMTDAIIAVCAGVQYLRGKTEIEANDAMLKDINKALARAHMPSLPSPNQHHSNSLPNPNHYHGEL